MGPILGRIKFVGCTLLDGKGLPFVLFLLFDRMIIFSGDKPELLYPEARLELKQMGYETTLEYVADAAAAVMRETGLLPHINAGTMGLAEVTHF